MAKCLLWQGAPRQAKQTPVKMSFKQNLQNIPTPVRGVEESCSPVKSNLEGVFRAPQQHCTITSLSGHLHWSHFAEGTSLQSLFNQGQFCDPSWVWVRLNHLMEIPNPLHCQSRLQECPPQSIFPFPVAFPGALTQRQQEQKNSVSSLAVQKFL